jgi:poly(hydroxyalkanoate) granule-associated protein
MPTKSKKEEVVEVIDLETNDKENHRSFLDSVHKVLLASIGAVVLAQEEIEDFVNKLIERGEIAEKDGRKMISEIMARRKKEAEKAEDQVNKRVEDVLSRMNVPTKTDIDALGEKVAVLTKKVDELKKTS